MPRIIATIFSTQIVHRVLIQIRVVQNYAPEGSNGLSISTQKLRGYKPQLTLTDLLVKPYIYPRMGNQQKQTGYLVTNCRCSIDRGLQQRYLPVSGLPVKRYIDPPYEILTGTVDTQGYLFISPVFPPDK